MSQIAKELKIKTLNSCPKTQWQGSGSAFTPNQLNIKRSKNRITALATNTYEESGNLSSSTKSISSPSEPSANSNMDVNRASSTSQEQHKGTIVKWANVTSEHDIDSEPLTSSIMSESE
ncbi:hypothetical protein M3Y96_01019900 [Aphelenchoides besseyi]|nr:hypothetical protein M3Y96_01019900 [Aphelenchoides besseyi]